jgi:SAM-dependent methyltransferase
MSGFASVAMSAARKILPEDRFVCVSCGGEQAPRRPVVCSDPVNRPFDLIRCGACGLVQRYPRPVPAQAAALYGEDYYVFEERESLRWARAVQQYAIHVARWETAGFRRLLDVGCALGHFAALAARRSWRVLGLDISGEAVSRAALRFDLDFRAGPLSCHTGTLPPFDLVFLGDVIEHVSEPGTFLRQIRQVLAPRGVVCIDTPNWGSAWRRRGRSHWLGLNRFHINLFDADSLTRLLTACGFADIRTGSYTHYRYEGWARRPEVQALVGRMPNVLAWRINRFLDRRGARTPWAILREHPPATLEDALRLLDDVGDGIPMPDTSRGDGDNHVG